jgi:MFS family permease
VSTLALPLAAALDLQATPAQMGMLAAIGSVPALVLSLPSGVWVDRRRKRPLLVAADIGRGVLLLAIPLAALLGALRMELLYVVALLTGGLGLLFTIAYHAFLPSLVGRAQLVEGNSKLEVSRSAAEIGGPALAGWLVAWVTAPVAIAVDAFSFLASAALLALIRVEEPTPLRRDGQNLWSELREGLRFVVAHRLLRSLALCVGTASFFNAVFEAVSILYLTRQLGIGPGLLGVIVAGGNVGLLLGALESERAARRLGVGRAMVISLLLLGSADLVVALAAGPQTVVVALLLAAQFVFGVGLTIFGVNQVSLRQQATPDGLQGRVNATLSFLIQGLVPVGALLGGALGETVGLRATLAIAAVGEMFAVFWLLGSPLFRARPEI